MLSVSCLCGGKPAQLPGVMYASPMVSFFAFVVPSTMKLVSRSQGLTPRRVTRTSA